jgi:signal transduction histidine kinase/ligand-binding sensor domain-containing protein
VSTRDIRNLLLRILSVLIVCSILFSPVFTIPVYAQTSTIRFENISTEQGLSQSTAHAILQDQQGFLWFATEGGLDKYDGYQFTVYQHDPGDPKTLGDNLITALYQDKKGNFWVGTSIGLDRFDPQNETALHEFQAANIPAGLSWQYVSTLFQDRTGLLWIGTDAKGLASFDQTTNTYQFYQHSTSEPQSLANNSINAIFEDSRGELWVGTNAGLDRFDRSTGRFHLAFVDSAAGSTSIGDNPVYAILETSQGDLWFGTNQGLFQWKRDLNQLINYRHEQDRPDSLSDNAVTCILEDSHGVLWIGTRAGLTLFDPVQNRFTTYLHNPDDPSSLASDSVRSLCEDRSGVLWIGTTAGLSKYAPSTQKFSLLTHIPGSANSLSDNNVWAVLKDRSGGLWVGTFSAGLNYLDPKTGKFTVYQHNPLNPISISSNEIRALLVDHNGTLWVGTERGGLDRFNASDNTFTHYVHDPGNPESLSGVSVFSLYEDEQANLWIGTGDGGLNRMDQSAGTFHHYQNIAGNPFSLSNDSVRAIQSAQPTMLWVGTFGGLNLFQEQGETFMKYLHYPLEPDSLSSTLIVTFYKDNKGTLWLGTMGGGLDHMNNTSRTFSHFTVKDGLPDNTVYCILGDASGNLWVSTNKGLSKINPVAHTFRNYEVSDGLQGNQFNPGACYEGQDGEMYFGGTYGLTSFFPDQVRDNLIPPPVVITDIKKFNRTIQAYPAANQEILLTYRDNFISFDFAALDYNAPVKNQYAYKLEGVDPDWVQSGTRRYASYTNLQGGDYTFWVKASNNDGVWSSTGTAVHIHITPPFWQTWWFIGIVCLVVGAGAFGGYRLRVRDIEAKNRELAQRVEQRTYELATLNTISEVVNRSLDLTEILNAALDKTIDVMHMEGGLAYRLEEADSGTSDGPILRLLAHRGVAEEYINLVKVLPLHSTLIQETVSTGKPDVRLVNDHPDPQIRKAIEQARVRLAINAPLLVQGKLVGAFTLATWEMREITQEEVALLKAIGQQVGIAMENARLYEHAEKRTRELATLNSLSGVVNRSLDLSEILNNAMDKTIEVMHLDGGLAFSLEKPPDGGKEGQYLKLLAYRGLSEEFAALADHLPLEASVALKAFETGKPYIYSSYDHPNPKVREANIQGNMRIGLSLALVSKGELIGSLSFLVDAPREFTLEELSLAEAVGQQVSMAMVNARLYEQAEQTAIAAERSRLARELHDSVTQMLYSVTLYAEAASELLASGETGTAASHLHELRDTAQEALREMRLLIFELHRPALEQGGLAAALQARLEAVETRGGVKADLLVDGGEQIPRPVQAELYNIAHEALNNALKHAHAESVQIHLRFGEDVTEMEISDNGKGFDPSAEGLGGGFGIPGMQERAKKISGTLKIISTPGKGARVIVRVPVNPRPFPNQAEAVS